MRRTGPTNIVLRKLIRELRKVANEYNAPIWDYVAEILARPTRRRVAVNLSKINKYSNEGDVVVVPGKVLGMGSLSKSITIAAFSYSYSAINKIKSSGSKLMYINDIIKENPRGSGVKVVT